MPDIARIDVQLPEPEIVAVRVVSPSPKIVRINVQESSTTFPADIPYFSMGGLQLGARVIDSNYIVQPTDFGIYVLGAPGDINIQLPPGPCTNNRGRYLWLEKLDDNDNNVAILPDGTDTIDDSISLNLTKRFTQTRLHNAYPGYWASDGSAPLPGDDGVFPVGNIRLVSIDGPPSGGKIQVWNSVTFEWEDGPEWTT